LSDGFGFRFSVRAVEHVERVLTGHPATAEGVFPGECFLVGPTPAPGNPAGGDLVRHFHIDNLDMEAGGFKPSAARAAVTAAPLVASSTVIRFPG
jgi:hypothetical protein